MFYPLIQPILVLWVFISIGLFAYFPARRAILIAYIIAWLFLPVATFEIPSLPDIQKETVASYGILLGVLMFDSTRILKFRPGWIDIPILIWLLTPSVTALTNDLGLKDAVTELFNQCTIWGIPYFLGRLYFNTLSDIRELVIAIFLGGLSYVLPCLYEARLSPQLHRMVYGYFPHDFGQTKRLGGWRPNVFMQHGLMVAGWMMASALSGLWIWQSRLLKHIWGVPVGLLSPILLVTVALTRSTGAYVLVALGIMIQLLTKFFKSALPVLALLILVPGYLGFVGINPYISTEAITQPVAQLNADRAASLEYRLENERELVDHTQRRPWFGWGGYGRNRPHSRVVTDSLWIIAYSKYGLSGLVGVFGLFLLPVAAFVVRYPAKWWLTPDVAPGAITSVIILMYSIDCLLNDMYNPVFILCAGSLAGLAMNPVAAPGSQKRAEWVQVLLPQPTHSVSAPVTPGHVAQSPQDPRLKRHLKRRRSIRKVLNPKQLTRLLSR